MDSRPQVMPHTPKARKARKLANVMVYSSILVLIASVASVSYRPPVDMVAEASSSVGALQSGTQTAKPSVDQLAVATLAAQTAEVAGLSVASEVTNMSITLNANNEISQLDEAVITKPLTFEPTTSGAIVKYRTKAGDTVPVIAARYGISTQTLKWANNLTTDALDANVTILVPTANGVVYTTKQGDTVKSLAKKYKSDADRIVSKNDLELTGIVAGQRILLPDGVLPSNERPGYVSPQATYASASTSSINYSYGAQAGNRYSYGYCTWYAYNRRVQLGRPVGSFWGNASSWAYMAAMSGYGVSHKPGVGDIMQNGGGAGHVAIVETVHDDGSITVSEMNYYGTGGGWARVSTRTLDAGAAAAYNFIK